MSTMIEWRKKADESCYDYKWRIYLAKKNGLLSEYSWEDITQHLNKELRAGLPPLTEAVYRKEAALLFDWYENLFCAQKHDKGTLALLDEVKKQRVLLADERTQANRVNREFARIQQQLDYLGNRLEERSKERYNSVMVAPPVVPDGSNELVVLLSDLHIGAAFSGPFGTYDSDKAKELLGIYLGRVVEIGKRYGIGKICVGLLGDQISGNIHKSIAVTNRENVIEQIIIVADLIELFIKELASAFPGVSIQIVNVCGNHTRLEPKEQALKDERLDGLLPFILKKALGALPEIIFAEQVDSSLAWAEIAGKLVVFVHGDLDALDPSRVAKLSLFLGRVPYCICCGHNHTPLYKEVNGVKIIQGGSLPGSGDDYTISKRLCGNPSQTCFIMNNRGIEAHYPVELGQ